MTRRPDRILFPETGFTIGDAVDYYTAIGKVLLPHLRNRPLSFKRHPDTVDAESFWEKDAPGFTPAWVKRFAVPRRGSDEAPIDYIVINDARTLKWVAGVGGIELHPFLHRVPKIDRATHVVFDLDPGPGADLADCCEVALILRKALDAIELQSFPKVSGSKGMQVLVPLNGDGAPHEVTETFARLVAEELARRHPRLIVAKMDKTLRASRVFIDWSQNADYKTNVVAYSLRTKRSRPLVSMPVTWEEVGRGRGLEWGPKEAVRRVEKVGDLFGKVLTVKQTIGGAPASGRPPSPRSRPEAGAPPRLPKPNSQSGRRLYLLVKTEMGNELWLDRQGRFQRWILRRDREGDARLIAMFAGDFPIDRAYYEARVPPAYRNKVAIEESGAYEVVEGSLDRQRFDLWFHGTVLAGAWVLAKTGETSWSLAPARPKSSQR